MHGCALTAQRSELLSALIVYHLRCARTRRYVRFTTSRPKRVRVLCTGFYCFCEAAKRLILQGGGTGQLIVSAHHIGTPGSGGACSWRLRNVLERGSQHHS